MPILKSSASHSRRSGFVRGRTPSFSLNALERLVRPVAFLESLPAHEHAIAARRGALVYKSSRAVITAVGSTWMLARLAGGAAAAKELRDDLSLLMSGTGSSLVSEIALLRTLAAFFRRVGQDAEAAAGLAPCA